jgi:hypothetical protein
MQISILQSTITGTVVYTETHSVDTNLNGLVSLEIGTGITSGTFSEIDWSAGSYFIKTETDPTGGSSYTITGTSQLMSVPFALYATTSGDGITTEQSDAIETNTAKTSMVLGTAAETALAGDTPTITTVQADAIAANTAKVGYTEAAVSANTDVAANTLKVSYTQPIYTVNTFYAELGGYVIQISPNGKHGLVVAMQDQGASNWYQANDLLSEPSFHDVNGAKFMDWRLPTKRELNLMYGVYIGGNGANLNSAGYYWSSTETGYGFAWAQNFYDSSHAEGDKRAASPIVCAVRAF